MRSIIHVFGLGLVLTVPAYASVLATYQSRSRPRIHALSGAGSFSTMPVASKHEVLQTESTMTQPSLCRTYAFNDKLGARSNRKYAVAPQQQQRSQAF